jgi:hypothetical protein
VRYRPQQGLVDGLFTLLLTLPAWSHLAVIAERRDNWKSFVRLVPYAGLRAAFWLYVVGPLTGLGITRLVLGYARPTNATRVHWLWVACWLAVPPSIAFAATLSGLAALWLLRYFIASLVAAMILGGMVFARYPGSVTRRLAAVVFVAAAIHCSGIVPQWQRDGRIVGDRNEDWPAAVGWVSRELADSPGPVVLCPGLIEDLALSRSADKQLIDYCLFPLQGIYGLPQKKLWPLPTTSGMQVPGDLQDLLSESVAAAAVIRARPATATIIQTKLVDAFARRQPESVEVELRQFGFLTAFVVRRR